MKYKNYYWEESKLFTLKEENRKLISNTNMSPQQVEELLICSGFLKPRSYERIIREVF